MSWQSAANDPGHPNVELIIAFVSPSAFFCRRRARRRRAPFLGAPIPPTLPSPRLIRARFNFWSLHQNLRQPKRSFLKNALLVGKSRLSLSLTLSLSFTPTNRHLWFSRTSLILIVCSERVVFNRKEEERRGLFFFAFAPRSES